METRGVRDSGFSSSEDEGIEETEVFDPLESAEEPTSFDLDDLSRGESGAILDERFQEKTEDDLPIDLEGLASSLDEPTEELSEVIKTEDYKSDDSLELEDLELDLDLEGPGDKSK